MNFRIKTHENNLLCFINYYLRYLEQNYLGVWSQVSSEARESTISELRRYCLDDFSEDDIIQARNVLFSLYPWEWIHKEVHTDGDLKVRHLKDILSLTSRILLIEMPVFVKSTGQVDPPNPGGRMDSGGEVPPVKKARQKRRKRTNNDSVTGTSHSLENLNNTADTESHPWVRNGLTTSMIDLNQNLKGTLLKNGISTSLGDLTIDDLTSNSSTLSQNTRMSGSLGNLNESKPPPGFNMRRSLSSEFDTDQLDVVYKMKLKDQYLHVKNPPFLDPSLNPNDELGGCQSPDEGDDVASSEAGTLEVEEWSNTETQTDPSLDKTTLKLLHTLSDQVQAIRTLYQSYVAPEDSTTTDFKRYIIKMAETILELKLHCLDRYLGVGESEIVALYDQPILIVPTEAEVRLSADNDETTQSSGFEIPDFSQTSDGSDSTEEKQSWMDYVRDLNRQRDPQRRIHTLMRKARGLLNKLTEKKFDRIAAKLKGLDIVGEELRQLADMVFEKAISEPEYQELYAVLISELEVVDKENILYDQLMDRCQNEFEREIRTEEWWTDLYQQFHNERSAINREKIKRIFQTKLRETNRRFQANIHFLGELYHERLVVVETIHGCLSQLFVCCEDERDTSEKQTDLESLCTLLKRVGQELENRSEEEQLKVTDYFTRLGKIMEGLKPSKTKFIVVLLMELKQNGWQTPRNHVETRPQQVEVIETQLQHHNQTLLQIQQMQQYHQMLQHPYQAQYQPITGNQMAARQAWLEYRMAAPQPLLGNQMAARQPLLGNQMAVQNQLPGNRMAARQPLPGNLMAVQHQLLENQMTVQNPLPRNQTGVQNPLLEHRSNVQNQLLGNQTTGPIRLLGNHIGTDRAGHQGVTSANQTDLEMTRENQMNSQNSVIPTSSANSGQVQRWNYNIPNLVPVQIQATYDLSGTPIGNTVTYQPRY